MSSQCWFFFCFFFKWYVIFERFLIWSFHFHLTHWLLGTFFVHSSVLDTGWGWWRIENWQDGLQKKHATVLQHWEATTVCVSLRETEQKSRQGGALNLAQIGAHWRSSPSLQLFPSGLILACCLPYSNSCLSITAAISSGPLLRPLISSGELDALSMFHVLTLHKAAETQVPWVFWKQVIYITVHLSWK